MFIGLTNPSTVQLDSISFNELGDPNELLVTAETQRGGGSRDGTRVLDDKWSNQANLRLVNLSYDVTPIDYVGAVITEVGVIPPSSAPVVVQDYVRDADIGV